MPKIPETPDLFQMPRRSRRSDVLVLVLVAAAIVTAASLRPGATSVGPVLPEVMESLRMNAGMAGLLTALPGICFAAVGILSNRLAAWSGLAGALLLGSVLTTLGLLSRAMTGSWALFLLFSAIALAGMAVGNVVLPALIKKEFPRRAAQMATVYTTFLAVGATVPTFLVPTLEGRGDTLLGSGEGWRVAIGVWASISLVAFLLWLYLYFRDAALRKKEHPQLVGGQAGRQKIWKSKTAVALMFFFGFQSMQAYIQFGWALCLSVAGFCFPTALTAVPMSAAGIVAVRGGNVDEQLKVTK